MTHDGSTPRPPARLRALASWQTNKVATIGARLTAPLMPRGGRASFAVLAALDEYGLLSQAELGRRLGLDRNDVHTVLADLHAQEHVERQTDQTDRRRNVIRITDRGRTHLADLQRHADTVQAELLHALTARERDTLQRLLDKVLDSHGAQSA